MAELLDPAAYSAPPVFQAERRRIFGKGWQVVGPAAAFADNGAYSALGLGGWAFLVMRGDDGVIRAFNNVCAHQKMPVVDNGRGRCDQLRCRYHGWTYNAAGRLISAPPTVAPDEDEFDEYGLDALPATTAGGLVFASLEEDVAGTPPAGAAGGDLDGLALVGDEIRSVNPNWKAVLDAIHGGDAAPDVSADGRFAWLQPVTGLWSEPDGTVMLLVVPRTFRKTELHLFALAADPQNADAVTDRAKAWADKIETAATARQEAVEAGRQPDAAMAARLAESHAWIRNALTEEPAA